MTSVLLHALRKRRTALAWWSLGIGLMIALLAVAYPTLRDNNELDKTFANLPPGVEALLGLAGGTTLTSPAGYLNSQYFANILPVMLLVFAVGAAAWTIAGDESAGTLELVLANPVRRTVLALARLAALVLQLATLVAVSLLVLLALGPSTGLNRGLTAGHMLAATVASGLLALTFAAVAFAVGAATASRPAALAAAAALATAGYVLEGLAAQIDGLHITQAVNPWHWLIATDPLRHGFGWQAWVLPLVTSAVLVGLALPRLAHRDLH